MLISYLKAKYLTKKTQAGSVEAIRLLDELLVQLVVSIFQLLDVFCSKSVFFISLCYPIFQASVPVDVMPGQYDPTNYTLPQQPLHRCMFPLSVPYPTLQLVSNPYQAVIDDVQ